MKQGSFSIALDTKTARQITAGKPGGRLRPHQVSGVLVLCPAIKPGSPVRELQVGFSGAKLKDKHLRFAVSYPQKHARLAVLNTGATTLVSAKLTVTGTVATAKLITGTVSVNAGGCSLRASNYQAALRLSKSTTVATSAPTGNPTSGSCTSSNRVAYPWYVSGMARVRISTTVDEGLLGNARRMRSELADSALIDEALAALLSRHRTAEIDASYSAYDEHPIDEVDDWGDLASFRAAAGAS